MWTEGSYFCFECQGNHRAPCLLALAPIRSGVAWSTEGESCHAYAVYDRAAVEATIGRDVAQALHDPDTYDLPTLLTGWSAFSRGPGRAFGSEPVIRIGRRRVLVRQFRALDI